MTHLRVRRLPALTLTAGLVALCLAACGSSSSTSSTSSAGSSGSAASATSSGAASGSGANRATIAACLKAHGVTLPARPGGGGQRPANGAGGAPGFFGGGGGAGGRFANNPKLRAAFQACGGGRGFGGRRRALSHAAVTKFVACVKQHGYNLPSPNFSGNGPIFPANIEKNAKFQAAAKSCQADLRPAGAPNPPAPGGPPPGSGTATASGA